MEIYHWVRQEMVRCGKKTCGRCPHGPYWYGYWQSGPKLHKRYIGKVLPKEYRELADRGDKPMPAAAKTTVPVVPKQPEEREGRTWAEEILGVTWAATREQVRRKVWNLCNAKSRTELEKVGIKRAFAILCELNQWAKPENV